MPFSRSDIAKVMNHADVTSGWLPSNREARDLVRAAIETGVLTGAENFYLTDEGDFFAVVSYDSFKRVTTPMIGDRYLWRAGLTGTDAVRSMLTRVQDDINAARTGVYTYSEGR